MADDTPTLDLQIEQLREEVAAGDSTAAQQRLVAIDGLLDRLDNPLVRGFAYAEVRAAMGQPQEAASVLDDLLALIGDDAVVYFQLGCYRRQAGDAQRAIEAFAAAARLDPTHVDAWLNLGTVLDDRAEPEAAIDVYRQALRVAPSHVGVWRNLGNSLAALRKFEESISAYETGLGLSPGDRTLVLLRAGAYQALGDVERANALTPAALAQEVGTVVEFGDDGWCCRFRCQAEQLSRAKAAAAKLLETVRGQISTVAEAEVRQVSGVCVVRWGSERLVCDLDPVRVAHPNRFFDASRAVAGDCK